MRRRINLPVEFFARVIWQESRFNAQAVSAKGAQGIAQFMPATADYRGLVDPFDPIEALKNSASYLHDLQHKFGNLGLAAAAYNAGPGRVGRLPRRQRPLPSETRNYVAIITGWTADEWASPTPPQDGGDHDPAGRAVHAARQSDPGAEGRGAARSRLTCRAGACSSPPIGRRAGPGRSIA